MRQTLHRTAAWLRLPATSRVLLQAFGITAIVVGASLALAGLPVAGTSGGAAPMAVRGTEVFYAVLAVLVVFAVTFALGLVLRRTPRG